MVLSVTLISSKWTAGAAGMEASTETSLGSKQQCMQKDTMRLVTETLAYQNGIQVVDKLSDSSSISHVLNLLVKSEDQFTHTKSH